MKFIYKIVIGLFFAMFFNSQVVIAEEIDNSDQLNKDSSERIENVKAKQKSSKTKLSEGDIFGDEQTFPFVAGLGKNAAH